MNRFDKIAKEWDLNNRRVDMARVVCKKILEIVKIDEFDILDYGCGTGLISFGLFEYAKSITAMDNSRGMISELNKKTALSNIKNIKTILHDIEKEDLPQNAFNMVVSSMTLHHLKKPDIFFKKSKNALKQNGYLAICDLFEEDGTFHTHGNEGVYHFGFSKDYIKTLYQNSKFEILFFDKIYTIEKNRSYDLFLAIGKLV